MHVAAPAPAYAWFGWLDSLSGPGPFIGGEFDFKLVCFVDTPRWTDAANATVAAYAILDARKPRLVLALASPKALAETSKWADLTTALNSVQPESAMRRAWTERIVNPPANSTRELEIIRIADDLAKLRNGVGSLIPDATERDMLDALDIAESLWRESTQPRVSVFPGSVAWASCLDNPKNNRLSESAVRHRDRRPGPALVIGYRNLRTTNAEFASGNRITLQIIEPKLSWPLSGSFDFLDGQAGFGRYWFTSDGFATQTGWMVEPVRLDLHFPARFADDNSALRRTLFALSYSAGIVMFPRGFQAGSFGAGTSAYAGSEAIFEQGIVLNLGRLLR